MAATYHREDFTPAERGRLRPYVSNLDGPVFVLMGLPQITAAALFARYSRSPKSLRRLLLDEFLQNDSGVAQASDAGTGQASALFGRVLAEYGDDSVAQLGGIHLACEQVSQPLAKAIEWGRLASYLEQSTRYIPYTDRRDGGYRYYRDPAIFSSGHGPDCALALDGLFDTYGEVLEPLRDHLDGSLPPTDDAGARRRAIRALALDIARSLLPAGTVSNLGVFASPQALEQMVMRLRAHSLPEAQQYAELIDIELQRTHPDFVSRLDRPDRGGRWVEYLRDTATSLRAEALKLSLTADSTPGVRLLQWDAQAEDRIIAGGLYPYADASMDGLLSWVSGLPEMEKDRLFAAVVGDRGNRRHRPGRGFEHADYTFEVVSDYGAFRDLQRHRLLTIQWQPLTPDLGWSLPVEAEAAGLGASWERAVEQAEAAHARLAQQFPEQAQYLVTLGHRIRYTIKLNAREALHMIELRTSPQGHPAYRQVCQEMHRLIREAGHQRVADAMQFVGSEDVHLPRYGAEAARVNAEV